jgi:hypothetical protein
MRLLLYITVLSFLFLFKQDKVVIKLETIPEIFTCDHLDNVYIYSKNTLKKFNDQGIMESQYSGLGYGNLSSIDVSDPFRIVLFYKGFNTVLILDNKLNQIGEAYQLNKLGFSTADAVCKSKQAGIWILDSYAQKLMLYSLNPRGFIREIDLTRYTKPIHYIENMLENGNEIYLFSKEKAVLVFNQLGGKLTILDAYPENVCQVKNNKLYYVKEGFFYCYNLEKEQNDTIHIEGFEIMDDIKIGNEKMFILNKDSVTIVEKPADF